MITTHQKTPLSDLITGECATIVSIGHGFGISHRLSSLGFTPGAEVVMVQNIGHGPLVVNVRGTRVALGRHESRCVLVQRNIE